MYGGSFFLVSRATFGSKCYVSPSFWRWSAPFPSWSLWVAQYENYPAHPDFMRYSAILSLLNKRRISLPGSAGVWKKRCYDRQQSRLKPLIFLTGDFAFLQKPLHPCISQLLAGQALSGKHDREWSVSLYFFLRKNLSSRLLCIFWGVMLCSLSLRFQSHLFCLLIEAITFSASIYPSVYLFVQLKLAS